MAAATAEPAARPMPRTVKPVFGVKGAVLVLLDGAGDGDDAARELEVGPPEAGDLPDPQAGEAGEHAGGMDQEAADSPDELQGAPWTGEHAHECDGGPVVE